MVITENLKNLKYHTSQKNISSVYYFSKSKTEDKRTFKREESTEILNIFGLIENIY